MVKTCCIKDCRSESYPGCGISFHRSLMNKLPVLEELRKFSTNRSDFPTMLENVAGTLRVLTINVDRRYTKRIPFFYYFFTLLCLSFYVYAFPISVCWFIFWRDAEEDPVKKIIAFSQMVTTTVSLTKVLHIYWNRKQLQTITDAYLLCNSKVVPFGRMSRNIQKTLKSVWIRAISFFVVVTHQVVIYSVVRPLFADRSSVKDYQLLWGLEPIAETPNFEITVAIITMTTPIVAFGPVFVICFLIVIAGYSEAYMLALSEELLHLWEDAETDFQTQLSSTQSSIDDFVNYRLKKIMKAHAQQKHMIQLVEDVFKNGIAFQLLLSSLGIVAALLGGLENTYIHLPFFLLMIGMDCYTGQNLIDASIAFESAVYRCKWERFDKTNMKSVLLMLQNAQMSMTLSAGGVAYLGYTCFFSIVKSIYSVYTGLH